VQALAQKREALLKQIGQGAATVAVRKRLEAVEKELTELTGETPKAVEDRRQQSRNRVGQYAANGHAAH
jgi:hypothetical protein